MDRRSFLAMLGTGIVAGRAHAGTGTSYKIGTVNFRALRPAVMEIFFAALHKYGYIQGQNLAIDSRFGEPNELPALAAALVRTDVQLISCGASAPLRAVMGATRTIPVVAIDLETDPVASGFAASLARPSGNMTGFFLDLAEFSAKRLELLKETLPKLRRVVALWDPVLDRAPVTSLERAANTLGLKLLLRPVENQGELEAAFSVSMNFRAAAVVVMQSPRLDILRPEILRLAVERHLPVTALFADFTADGGLLSYGPSVDDMTAQTADYIDKILRGAKPGDLPIQRPTRFDFVFNLRTAKRLGISVPPSVLARADTVIQ